MKTSSKHIETSRKQRAVSDNLAETYFTKLTAYRLMLTANEAIYSELNEKVSEL